MSTGPSPIPLPAETAPKPSGRGWTLGLAEAVKRADKEHADRQQDRYKEALVIHEKAKVLLAVQGGMTMGRSCDMIATRS
jgi:hypothetical protein